MGRTLNGKNGDENEKKADLKNHKLGESLQDNLKSKNSENFFTCFDVC